MGLLISALLLYFFYDSMYVFFPALFCSYFYCMFQKRELAKKRQRKLELEFKEWILIVSSKLQAGYGIENAFTKAGKELGNMFDDESDLRRETENLERLIENNVTIERALQDLARRSGVENIADFAEVFIAAKRSGGNLNEMILSTSEIIMMKIDTQREIETILHGRKMEQRIMCFIPFGMILYIRITSPGYFDPLYHNILGIIVMSICLGLYLISVGMSFRLVAIDV